MKLASYVDGGVIDIGLHATSIENLFKRVVEDVQDSGVDLDVDKAVGALMKREKICSTGVGKGLAIPHATLEDIDATHMAVATLSDSMDFNAIDDRPVRLVIMLISPPGKTEEHVGLLARISRICSTSN